MSYKMVHPGVKIVAEH